MVAGTHDDLAAILDGTASNALRIAVLCVGAKGFWEPEAKGVKDARNALADKNTTVEWMVPPASSEGLLNAATFTPVIRNLIAKGYDGICLPIYDAALVPVINEAVEAGITVSTFNAEPTNLREMVSSVSTHTVKLIGVSQKLAASATQSGHSTEHINATINTISSALEIGVLISGVQKNVTIASEKTGKGVEEAGRNVEIAKKSKILSRKSTGLLKSTTP